MIKFRSYKCANDSVYICDMCKIEMQGPERFNMTIKRNKDYRSYHLCERCSKILIKNIENWDKIKKKKKEQEENEKI